jgi:hypothetical protein
LGRDVAHAKFFEIDGFAMLLDQDDGAGNPAARDLVLDVVADLIQPGARKTSRCRRRRFRAGPVRGSDNDRPDQTRNRRRNPKP